MLQLHPEFSEASIRNFLGTQVSMLPQGKPVKAELACSQNIFFSALWPYWQVLINSGYFRGPWETRSFHAWVHSEPTCLWVQRPFLGHHWQFLSLPLGLNYHKFPGFPKVVYRLNHTSYMWVEWPILLSELACENLLHTYRPFSYLSGKLSEEETQYGRVHEPYHKN